MTEELLFFVLGVTLGIVIGAQLTIFIGFLLDFWRSND
jgi:hypothetical protein